jgi:hypothetical protein
MKKASTNRRRLRSGAAILLVLGVLGAAAFFAVGHFTGASHAKIATIAYHAPKSHGKVASKGEPGEMTVRGEGKENNEISARDKWFFHQRAYPNKVTPAGALDRAMQQTISLRRSSTDRETAAIPWSRIGPNPIATIGPDASFNSGTYGGAMPVAGRVSAIAPAPSNSSIVYLGGANGGIWKTTNGGTSWAPVWPTTMASFSIGSIAVNPANANDVWVGTGEANNSGDTYYGNGLYHSTNGGTSWTRVDKSNQFAGCFISGLDFVSTSVVNAAVLEFPGVPNPACATSKRGVWHITNASGTTPTLTHVSLPGSSYQAPNNFASVSSSPNTIYVATYLEGIWRSVNGGASWVKIINASGYYRQAVSAYNVSTVYLVLSDSNGLGFGGLYRIGNANGSSPTITPIANAASSNSPCTYPNSGGGQCSYDLTVAADPTNVNRSFVGGIRVYRFTYAGKVTPGTPIGYGGNAGKIHVDQHATIFDSAHNMWEGSDGGAYRLPVSQLGVAAPAFTNRNGSGGTALGISEFTGWTSGSTFSGSAFIGGLQDNGTVKYMPTTGLNWRMDHGGDGGASAYINSNTYFASYYGTGVFRTTTGGNCSPQPCQSYKQVFSSSDNAEFYPPMEQDLGNLTTLYRGTDRIWRTVNATAATPSWSAISPHFSAPVTAIGVQKAAAPAYLYAGVDAGSSTPTRVYYTHNGTAASPTWSYVAAPNNRYVTDIWVSPANAARAVLTESGFGGGHVYKTINGGATWTNISGNLPNVPVNAIAVDPSNENKVFLGTDTGVFWTTTGTAASPTWSNTSTGLPNTTVMDIRIDGTRLVAATHGRSAWVATKP